MPAGTVVGFVRALSASPPGRRWGRHGAVAVLAVALCATSVLVVVLLGIEAWSSIPAATGLGVLAWSDLHRHRLPPVAVRLTAATTAAALIVQSFIVGSWQLVLRAGVAAVGVDAALFVVWWAAPGVLAFGDVRVAALTGAAAAAESWAVLVGTILVACVAGGAVALALRQVSSPRRRGASRTVPLAPGLFAGLVVGVSLC